MADKDPDLQAAYGLQTPDDSKRLYAAWAQTYDATFAQAMDYRMPGVIAEVFMEVAQGAAPVLDVGAGTGLFAAALPEEQGLALDALDISAEMLEVAGARGGYRELLQCDLTQDLPIKDDVYGAIVSAGTFTHGHVGPEALDELLRIAQVGAVFVLGINAAHFEALGFAAKFAALEPHIKGLELREVNIYGNGADAAHREDRAQVAVFWKR